MTVEFFDCYRTAGCLPVPSTLEVKDANILLSSTSESWCLLQARTKEEACAVDGYPAAAFLAGPQNDVIVIDSDIDKQRLLFAGVFDQTLTIHRPDSRYESQRVRRSNDSRA